MDTIDVAQGYNEDFQAYALIEQTHNREPDDNDSDECITCHDEIPEERRRAKPGCRRCITCQEAHEIHKHWRAL